MFLRGFVIWFVIALAAVVNGAAREKYLRPRFGETTGHILSTVILCAVILLFSYLTVGWIGPQTRQEAFLLGGFWVALTLAFEFLAGHYLFGNSWEKLVADYNLFRGRVWLLVVVTTLLVPLWAFGLRHAR
jgi:hypothetical protein